MFHFELESTGELMAAYRAVMAAKFGAGADPELLLSEDLARFGNRVVDALIMGAHRQGNEAAAEALEDWREFKRHYPQARVLATAISAWEWWGGAGRVQRERAVRLLLAPLTISSSELDQWLGDAPPWQADDTDTD